MLHDVFVAQAIAAERRFEVERAAADHNRRAAQEAVRASRRERRAALAQRLLLQRRRPNRSRFEPVSVNPRPTS